MSRIMNESREEAKRLFNLGLIEEADYRKMMKLTVREVSISDPEELDGEHIAQIRESIGFSQAAFSQIFGVGSGVVSKWERNKSHPSKLTYRVLHSIEEKGSDALKVLGISD